MTLIVWRMSNQQIAVRLEPDLRAYLEARAKAEHRTLAAMVRAILEDARLAQSTPFAHTMPRHADDRVLD
jgi:hypothetical protein